MSDLFNLIDEKDLLEIYDKIDQNTPTNIYPFQESRSENVKVMCLNSVTQDGQIFDPDFNNNAEFIIFPNGSKYIKFYLPINIFSISDINNDKIPKSRSNIEEEYDIGRYLISAFARGSANKDTMNVFVNGVKVPDKAVLLTIYDGMTDVYFQSSFLDRDINQITFIAKGYNNTNKYCNYTWIGNSLNGYNIDKRKNHFLYRNGYLLDRDEYVVNEKGNIYVNNTHEDDILEFIYTEFSLRSFYIEKGNIFHLHELNFDFSKNPISPFIINIYKDGLLVNPSKLVPLNGSYFLLDEYNILKDNTTPYRVNIYLNLTYLESDDVNYADKFSRVNNLYNRRLIQNKLLYGETPYYYLFPDYFNTIDMMMDYPPVYINNHIKNPLDLSITKREFCKTAINNYIKLNNFYMEHFLNKFNQPNQIKAHIELDGEENKKENYIVYDTSYLPNYYDYKFDEARFLISVKHDGTKKFVEKLFVDTKLLTRDQYITIDVQKNGMVYYYIDAELINEDSTIEVIFEEGNLDRHKYDQIHFIEGQKSYMLDLDLIEYKKMRYDILPFFVIKDGRHIYLTRYDDYDIEIRNGKFFVRIINEDILRDYEYMTYYNPFIVFRTDKYVYFDKSNPQVFLKNLFTEKEVELFFGENASTFNLEIYHKGRRLIDGIDFLIFSPDLYNSRKDACIIINFDIDFNEKCVFIMKERRQSVIFSKDNIRSRYGLMYMPNILQPYGKEYMDLFINNKLVDSDNIIKYSNDFLQIRNIRLFKYFFLVSNVDLPQDLINQLMNQSRSAYSFETFFKKLVSYDNRIDTTYEKVKDYDISSDEIIPTEPDEDGSEPVEIEKMDLRYDILFMHFKNGLIDKKIACNDGIVKRDTDNYFIFDLFDKVVDLDANRRIFIFYAYQNANVNAYSIPKISDLFGQTMLKPKENIDGELEDFENHKMNEYIYHENIIRLDANVELNNQYTYNANKYFKEDKEEETSLEDIIVVGD